MMSVQVLSFSESENVSLIQDKEQVHDKHSFGCVETGLGYRDNGWGMLIITCHS